MISYKRIYWVERLTFADLTFFIFLSSFLRIQVRYYSQNISRISSGILRILQRFGFCNNFICANLTLWRKNPEGYAINYELERDLATCLESFTGSYLPNENDFTKLTAKSYIISHIFYRAAFITMVVNDEGFLALKTQSSHIFCLVRHPCNLILISFYEKKGYKFRQSFFSFDYFKFYARPFYLFLHLLMSKITLKRIDNNINPVKSSIWIEYGNHSFNFAFWRDEIDKNKFDIVYYLDRSDDGPLSNLKERIEKSGSKWVDLHFKSLVKFSKLKLAELIELLRQLNIPFSYPFGWYKVFNFEFKMWFLLYRKVFEHFKVKIVIQHQEASWVQAAQVRAIEASGGIMMGFHWSYYQFWQEPLMFHPQHVFFVWGKVDHDRLRKNGNLYNAIIPCGIWTLPESEEDDDRLKKFTNKVDFSIAIFDSSVASNHYQTPSSLSEFYNRVLNLLNDNPGWGGIIKSKNWNIPDFASFPDGGVILSRIRSLIDENRLLVLDKKTLPAIASKYADLSVCYVFNSAGIISGILGRRAVHWDCSGWLENPFYKERDQKVTFPDFNKFQEAIIQASKGDKSIGDFSRWRKDFNYFNDFCADKRVGRFIQSYMEASTQSNDYRGNLDCLVNRYIEENKVGKDFFTDNNLWD